MPNHTELAFETAIEHSLLTEGGYQKRPPAAFDPVNALFPVDVIDFIRESQPIRWAQLEAMLKDRTAEHRRRQPDEGTCNQGRAGCAAPWLQTHGKELRLVYFRPNSGMNPESAARYAPTG